MPRRKPAERRVGRGTRDLGVIEGGAGKAPALSFPGGAPLAATRKAWDTFWSGELAQLVQQSDMPALTRLFGLYDLRERMERALRKRPFVEGSTGQIVVHPAAKELASLDRRIDSIEPRFGITPLGRMHLGIAVGAAAKSLEELNADFDDQDDDDGQEPDPRVRAIDTGAREA